MGTGREGGGGGGGVIQSKGMNERVREPVGKFVKKL
jgi:hypothetical protein